MPIEVKILDSELTGFSAPAQDRLREAMQEYATSVVQEANRIESSRNIGHGPNEITSAMVSSAVVVQQQGLGPRRQSIPMKLIKITSGLLCAFSGYMFDEKLLQGRLYLTIFVVLIVFAIVTTTVSGTKGMSEMEQFDRDKYATDANEITQFASIRARRNFTVDLVLKTYAYVGLLTTVGGLFYFLLITFHISINFRQQSALMISAFGLVFSTVAWTFMSIRRQKELYESTRIREYAYTAELVEGWTTFEYVSRRLLDKSHREINQYSPRALISGLKQSHTITEPEAKVLQEALELRNMVVHGISRFPLELIIKVANELGQINARIAADNASSP